MNNRVVRYGGSVMQIEIVKCYLFNCCSVYVFLFCFKLIYILHVIGYMNNLWLITILIYASTFQYHVIFKQNGFQHDAQMSGVVFL
jgi:dolichyl-phosphate-mannose--protein O-mannosyl transferase